MAIWILESRKEPPIVLRLPAGAVKTLGRTAHADFIVDAALVSRVHCRLTGAKDEIVVEDLDSTNGILVNGRKVSRSPLRAGDTLTVGRVEFVVSAS